MDKIKFLINHFDNIFGTDTNKTINYEDMKLLKAIYSYLEERITTPSKRYKEIRHKRVVISEQLRTAFTDEQRTRFDEYCELGNEMQTEELEQVFLFACILLREIDIECKNK